MPTNSLANTTVSFPEHLSERSRDAFGMSSKSYWNIIGILSEYRQGPLYKMQLTAHGSELSKSPGINYVNAMEMVSSTRISHVTLFVLTAVTLNIPQLPG
jgi:hypothetical protein